MQDKDALLILNSIPHLNNNKILTLIDKFGCAKEVFNVDRKILEVRALGV